MNKGHENGTLPDGWTYATLGQILCDVQPGFASGKHGSNGDGLPHLRPMNVTRNGRIDRGNLRLVASGLADKPARRLRKGDVLFNNTNSLELVGKTALFDAGDAPAFSNHMTRLRVKSGIADPAFVAQFLHGRWQAGDFQRLANNHVSQASISRAVLTDLPIALPPLAEQSRIAEHLDEIEHQRVSAGSHLQAVRTGLDRLRSAVLAAACSGRLTRDWREQHPDAASVEHAIADAASSRHRRTRRRSESAVDLELPELPPSYVVTTVGAAANLLEYGTSKRCDALPDAGIPILRMGNIQDGQLELSDLKYCRVDQEIDRLFLKDGDLLFNRTNSPDLVGKSAVFRSPMQMSFASYLIRVRFAPDVAHPDFVNYWINSTYGLEWARLVKTDGVSQSNINGTKLSLMPLPLPPLDEQAEIVRRASAALAVTGHLAGKIKHAEDTLDLVFRASFAKAFRGDLVPTEAALAAEGGRDFESAEELLAHAMCNTSDHSKNGGRQRSRRRSRRP